MLSKITRARRSRRDGSAEANLNTTGKIITAKPIQKKSWADSVTACAFTNAQANISKPNDSSSTISGSHPHALLIVLAPTSRAKKRGSFSTGNGTTKGWATGNAILVDDGFDCIVASSLVERILT